MRKLIVAAWLTATSLLVAVPAAADSPVTLPPLAAGEVLLETNAIGIATSPATSARLTIAVSVEGATEAEARRAAAAAVQRVTAAARAAGVAASDIDASAVEVSSDPYLDDMMMNAAMEANLTTDASEVHTASATVTIRMRSAAATPALHRTLEAIDNVNAGVPEYSLDDDSAARRTARGEAVRKARADAEAYAAALGMRLGRVLRVTERTGLDFLGMAFSESNTAMRTFRDYERSVAEGQVMTFVVVGVDYALTPR
ncbi:MAG TPA: SIMPL domain-containing protein [Allosphingosinicella sp.]|jgi:hypothetical protein